MNVSTPSEVSVKYRRVYHDDTARARATLETLIRITLSDIRQLPGLDDLEPEERRLFTMGDVFVMQQPPEVPDHPYDGSSDLPIRHEFTISSRTVIARTSYTTRSRVEGAYSGKNHEVTYGSILPTCEFTIQGLAQLTSELHHLHGRLIKMLL